MSGELSGETEHEIIHAMDELGLERSSFVEVLHERRRTCLCRVKHGAMSYVLKWCPPGAEATEVRAYRLLQDLGVPTLRVHACTENALLLEDLTTSPEWRLASAALARRYLALVRSGARTGRLDGGQARQDGLPGFRRGRAAGRGEGAAEAVRSTETEAPWTPAIDNVVQLFD
jgi:hypothetical protein